MVDGTIQVIVAATELLLIVIVGHEALVVGAHPYILARVLEDLCDESRLCGEGFQLLGQKIKFEDAIL